MQRFLSSIRYLIFLLIFSNSFAQEAEISGQIKDVLSGESLPFANIVIDGTSEGATTDLFGNFSFKVEPGTYLLRFSCVGFKEITQEINARKGINKIDFKVEQDNVLMEEVSVVADVAIARETPVAFSTVPLALIQNEISVADISVLLNNTPGVFVTENGGGDGDSEITIRGFKQRNIAVMIDGIPVNDMESGSVYWSNWVGLANVARSIQVQRGLGASKLALPSIGGTINVLSKGIEAKPKIKIKQDYGVGNFLMTTISGTTGRLPKGWGLTFTGSYRQRDGWVDNTWSQSGFYFLKLEKQFKKHLLGFAVVGAPQEHAQRRGEENIAIYDKTIAANMGVDTSQAALDSSRVFNNGIQFNRNWGTLRPWTVEDGDTTFRKQETISTNVDSYHKPMTYLKHFWTPTSNFALSNIAYFSYGQGGVTKPYGGKFDGMDDDTGQMVIQELFNDNSNPENFSGPWDGVTPRKSSGVILADKNKHFWYGLLSTFSYDPNDNWNLSGGLDLRYYKGVHYGEIVDLLGGDYFIDPNSGGDFISDYSVPQLNNRVVGDIVNRNYETQVAWTGFFSQAEYKKNNISTFINLTGAATGYGRLDYYRPRDLVLKDTTIRQILSASDRVEEETFETYTYNGNEYTIASPEATPSKVPFTWLPGFTLKVGLNWNFSERQNIFFNTGYIRKAPPLTNVITPSTNELFPNLVYEKIHAYELGYGFQSRSLDFNLNAYYTAWLNKPVFDYVPIDGVSVPANISGLRAHHRGIELDFSTQIIPNKVQFDGLISIGDWIWKTDSTDVRIDAIGADESSIIYFSANNVHVGDAAQIQAAASLQYDPIKNVYLKVRVNHFGKLYPDFDPDELVGSQKNKEGFKLDPYTLVNLYGGYEFSLNKAKFKLGFGILNLFNKVYISNATSGGFFGFEPDNVGVHFGIGRRWSTSFSVTF